MIYTALLLEIIYHIHSMPWAAVVNVALLFSLYYIFILLVFRRKLNINVTFQNALMYLFLVLLIITISVSTSSVVTAVLSKELDSRFYLLHLLQWIPFIYLCFTVIPDSDFHKNKISYWVLSLAFITAVSCEAPSCLCSQYLPKSDTVFRSTKAFQYFIFTYYMDDSCQRTHLHRVKKEQ